MRLPIRSWKKTLGKLGLRVKDEQGSRKKSRHRFSMEMLEQRIVMTVGHTFSSGLLTFTGDSANDTITVGSTNVSGTDYVTLNGSQVASITAASVTGLKAYGGTGNDTIDLSGVLTSKFTNLTNGSVEIYGQDGADTMTGTALDDTITGSTGNDTYKFVGSSSLGNDTLVEASGGGADTIDFSGLTMGGGSSGVTCDLNGTASASNGVTFSATITAYMNHVIGTSKGDVLTGNPGNNNLTGGDGDDIYKFAGTACGTDAVYEGGGTGNDTIDFSGIVFGSGADGFSFNLDTGAFTVDNTGGFDLSLSFPSGNGLNAVIGTNKKDDLRGTTGVNRLEGGAGSDDLYGGDGNDVYVFSGSGNLGTLDDIVDSAGVDVFDFSGLTFSGGSSGVTANLANTSNTATASGNGVTMTVDVSSGSVNRRFPQPLCN